MCVLHNKGLHLLLSKPLPVSLGEIYPFRLYQTVLWAWIPEGPERTQKLLFNKTPYRGVHCTCPEITSYWIIGLFKDL
jgi:hypothetical protein